MLPERKNMIDEQLLDLLLSFTDFQIFKEMMLDFKQRKKDFKNGLISITIEKLEK